MRVFITGATGLIGSQLLALLTKSGHQVIRLVRSQGTGDKERSWDATAERLPADVLNGCDVLVHLAGEGIAVGRWTPERKRRIRESRVNGTRILAEAIRETSAPPRAFIVASAIGFYGDRGDEVLDESSAPGAGFLSEVCQAWEAAAEPARDRCRVVHVRTGVVLSREGGALAKMLLPFKMGVGGVVGDGKQYMSWISVQDSGRLFQFAVENDSLVGAVNGVSPQPMTNREFTKTLGRVLGRPTILPMPAFAARLALGEMADELLLASARVLPRRAVSAGFAFLHSDLETALQAQNL